MATTSSGWPYTVSTDTLVGWPALSQTLANKLETDITQLSYPATNAQTGTTYTFVLADSTRLVTASNAGSQTYTIPPQSSVAYKDGTVLRVTSLGAGTVTFAGGVGVTVTNTAGTLSQYQSAVIVRTASNAWTVIPFTGGASLLSDSAISGTTGSPATATYTSGGINYKTYTFTGAGSITFTKSGLIDILVVGSGGAGASGTLQQNGGGGAGMYLRLDGAYMQSGTANVIIGAGGATTGNRGYPGNPSSLSIGADYVYTGIAGGGGSDNGGAFNGYGSGGGGAGNNGAGGTKSLSGGNNGGNGTASGSTAAGGGGGAGAVGGAGSGTVGGSGGAGTATDIRAGSSVTYAGGGGGGGSGTNGSGGAGGGGAAGTTNGTAGTANTGGGGGGSRLNGTGAAGGSGIVIVRVKA